jgi:hypothetical protein
VLAERFLDIEVKLLPDLMLFIKDAYETFLDKVFLEVAAPLFFLPNLNDF